MHEGGCTCGAVRYRLNAEPIIVHCCHCRWCQRETGTAFALNAVIESEQVELLGEPPERIDTPSASGKGQPIFRCRVCKVALWSHYGGAGEKATFVRVGTLDNPDACPPDVHIFSDSKQPWVILPPDVKAFAQFYTAAGVPEIYGANGVARWAALRG
ncbi:MAG: GFA family protein [Sphingopyxis sp.]